MSCSRGTRTGIRRTASPGRESSTEPGIVVYRFGAGIFYANAQRLTDEVLALTGGDTPPRWFVLDGSSIDDIDFTGGKTLAELGAQLRQSGITVAGASIRQAVREELERFDVTRAGNVRVFDTVDEALAAFRAESGSR